MSGPAPRSPNSPGRIPARLLLQQAIVGTARWAWDLARPTPLLEDEPLPSWPSSSTPLLPRYGRRRASPLLLRRVMTRSIWEL